MGFKPSPYWAVRFYYLAEEFARGNRWDKDNPLRWDRVILNLPGAKDFNPALPWVMKWNALIENIAGDIVAFVDDLRISGVSEEVAWAIARLLMSRLQYLGLQDASRKTKPPTRNRVSAWAGTVFKTGAEEVKMLVTEDKWIKARKLVEEI